MARASRPTPLTDDERARAARAEPRRRAAAWSRATIRNGSTRSSPRTFGEERAAEGAALARARRSICASTRSRRRASRRAEALAHLGAGADALVAARAAHRAVSRMPRARRSMPSRPSSRARSRSRTRARSLRRCCAGAKPGEQVVDLCAGARRQDAGARRHDGERGQIYATDTDKRRLAPIHERLERAGARNVQVRTPKRRGRTARRSRRPRRPRADRCALHRHRRLAAQSRRQMAGAPGRARRAR